MQKLNFSIEIKASEENSVKDEALVESPSEVLNN